MDDDRPRGGKGGRRGGGSDRFSPYGGDGGFGGGKGAKGAAKGRAMRRAEPSINARWVHDKCPDGQQKRGGATFHRITVKDEAPEHDAIECRCYLSNIPWGWKERWEEGDIKSICETVAPVKRVTLYYDHSGRPNGTGMVTYHTAEAAQQAVEMLNGATLGEKKQELSVTPAKISSIGSTKRNQGGFGQQRSSRLSQKQMERLFGSSEAPAETSEPAQPSRQYLDDQLSKFLSAKEEAAEEPAANEAAGSDRAEDAEEDADAAMDGDGDGDADVPNID